MQRHHVTKEHHLTPARQAIRIEAANLLQVEYLSVPRDYSTLMRTRGDQVSDTGAYSRAQQAAMIRLYRNSETKLHLVLNPKYGGVTDGN